ncbi:LacI family DNA-binding transcriptional regulator [Silvimonas sp. JCM 19000]
MNTSPVTLAQVAAAAGVSPSTVSRILNGTARVDQAKRAAVESAIAALNFQPNAMAQGLARGRTMTIGVLTQDISSPFYNEILQGVEDGLVGTGFAPIFASGHWNADEEIQRLTMLARRPVDGLIVLTGAIPDDLLTRFAERVPMVTMGHRVVRDNAVYLQLDNEHAAYQATCHLLDLGHVAIAHIAGPPHMGDSIARLQGYQRALAERNIEFNPGLVVQGDFRDDSGVVAVAQLLESRQHFTALFAANDQMAIGARLAFYRRGIRIPEDVSLIGFDDLPAASFCTPPLTTVRQPVYEIGYQSASALMRLLRGEKCEPIALPLTVVVRESTQRRRY